MARTRGFDEADAVRAAARVFTRHGYEGTSVDDLVADLGIHRGSLYRVFGSKLALFHRALRNEIEEQVLPWIKGEHRARPRESDDLSASAPVFGLVLVACMELSQTDAVVRTQLGRVVAELRDAGSESAGEWAALVLGGALLDRAGLTSVSSER